MMLPRQPDSKVSRTYWLDSSGHYFICFLSCREGGRRRGVDGERGDGADSFFFFFWVPRERWLLPQSSAMVVLTFWAFKNSEKENTGSTMFFFFVFFTMRFSLKKKKLSLSEWQLMCINCYRVQRMKLENTRKNWIKMHRNYHFDV